MMTRYEKRTILDQPCLRRDRPPYIRTKANHTKIGMQLEPNVYFILVQFKLTFYHAMVVSS
jgi:hypothetical protein